MPTTHAEPEAALAAALRATLGFSGPDVLVGQDAANLIATLRAAGWDMVPVEAIVNAAEMLDMAGATLAADNLRFLAAADPAPAGASGDVDRAGDWRHAKWCRWERGGEAGECDCGLDPFRAALTRTP